MSPDKPSHVIVGGGIAGLLCALLLVERKQCDVTIVERDQTLGGLLGKIWYPQAGGFDFGAHNLCETGIGELDQLLFGLLPEDEWQILEGNRRDLAGAWFGKTLQHNSPYPDLRSLPLDKVSTYKHEIFEASKSRTFTSFDALDESRNLFGSCVTQEVIAPILSAQFGVDPSLLHSSVLRLTNLHRVVLVDENEFFELAEEPGIRERIAFPEQRKLPEKWASGRRAFYPKKYGIHRVVDAIESRLRSNGVRILKSSTPYGIKSEAGVITSLQVKSGNSTSNQIRVDHLHWTAGLHALVHLFDFNTSDIPFDIGRPTWVVNLLSRNAPLMEDLFYFYNYSRRCNSFRVTNYSAYCDGAARQGQFPLAVELLMPSDADEQRVVQLAIDDLVAFGVLADVGEITFAGAKRLNSGIPLLTRKNISATALLRDVIGSFELQNLTVIGAKPEQGNFFQKDILTDVWLSQSH